MKSILKITCITFSLVLICARINAQDYPFVLPEPITATLTVDTVQKEKFKNELLGYNIDGFNTSTEKAFMRKFNPVSVRVPLGVSSNFYQWQTDGYQNDSYDNSDHEAMITQLALGSKFYLDQLAALNSEKKQKEGKGYSVMWTYCPNFDDAASCVARALKDSALGFEVKDIELGNEHFWKNQRSNQTATEALYVARAKSIAEALHNRFPEVRVSVPFSWRRNHDAYNRTIANNKTYYDAISLHKYMGADPDVPGESNTAYATLLTSRLVLDSDVKWIRSNVGEKPIWMTEWGVSANSDVEVNSAACLGMADVYLYMSENQQIFDRANWFIFNKALNPMVVVGSDRRPIYPLQKRGYLSVYEILQTAFMDAEMLQSDIVSTKVNGQMNAVNARIVEKEGKKMIVAVNIANKEANFVVKFGDVNFNRVFTHQALVFDQLGPVPNIGIDVDPKITVKVGTGAITLPPLSVSLITFDEDIISHDLGFMNLIDGQVIAKGSNLTIEANVGSAYTEVSLWNGSSNLGTLTSAPFQWSSIPALTNMTDSVYNFKLIAKNIANEITEMSIKIFTPPTVILSNKTSLHIGFDDNALSHWLTDGESYGVIPQIIDGPNTRSGSKVMAFEYTGTTSGHHVQNIIDNIVVPDQSYFHIIAYTASSDIAFGTSMPTAKLGDWAPTPSFTSYAGNNTFERKVTSRQNTKGSAQNCFPRLRSKASGACTVYWDDIVLYAHTSSTVDLTAPATATDFTINKVSESSNQLSWAEGVDAETGVNETYILRTTQLDAVAPVLLPQVAYSASGANGTEQMVGDWQVIASLPSGTTTYTDNALSANEGYKYAIVHKDLAYNYSEPLVSVDGSNSISDKLNLAFQCFGVKGSIELADLKPKAGITIFNISGVAVFVQQANSTHLSVSVPQGIYLVRVDNAVSKVIVK